MVALENIVQWWFRRDRSVTKEETYFDGRNATLLLFRLHVEETPSQTVKHYACLNAQRIEQNDTEQSGKYRGRRH